ncbi:hypothetical protein, partial [Acinetobacter baumannii]|uniref:hypothetical protein n=1 Tax=Acinetobacter baumannii TaxID=470 RepID=UPI001BC88715
QVTSADQGVTKTTYDAWGRQLIVNRNNNLTSYTPHKFYSLMIFKSFLNTHSIYFFIFHIRNNRKKRLF